MLLSKALLAGVLATIQASATSNTSIGTYCTPQPASPCEQKVLFEGWVQEFYIVRNIPKAFHTYVAQDFIQHNPFEAPYGAAPSQKYLTALFGNASIGFEVLHQGFENEIGWVHWRINNLYPLPVAVADIFRWNGSCIQEHWDVIQELPANATNPIALF